MKREQAIELARWAFEQHAKPDLVPGWEPHEWMIDAVRLAGASGKVEGAELVLQLIRTKGMLATLLDLVRELTETLDNTSNDLDGEAQALVNALLGRAKAALDQADQARLGEFAGKPVGTQPIASDLLAHLRRQREFSERTFGPGARTKGVLDHIRRELVEIEGKPHDVYEWIDVVLLALDGAWRAGHSPEDIVLALAVKQERNERRTWPDWRTQPADKAIEHVRTEQGA